MYEYFLQVLGMWLLSIVKFIATPFVMIFQPGDQWSFLETILVTASGAACGAFIFFHFGELIFNWWAHHFPSNRKKMTRGNRWIVKMKMRYGIRGILIISGLLSVPIASMVMAKLYRHHPSALPQLLVAFFVWASALTSIAWGVKNLIP
jgi:hypothetical protein